MLTDARKAEIQQAAIDAINGMGSRFFHTTIVLNDIEESVYAAGLWHSERKGLEVTYFATERPKPKISEVDRWLEANNF